MPHTNKHTPTPWFTRGGEIVIHKRIVIGVMRHDAGNLPGDANAAHLVRCVNEREELLKALKELEEQVSQLLNSSVICIGDGDDDMPLETYKRFCQAKEQAFSVLTKALVH